MTQLAYILLFFLIACGNTTNPYDEKQFQQKFFLENSGYYRAPFTPINTKVGGGVTGKASIFINNIQFYAKVNLQTSWSGVSFLQMIHASGTCPTSKDDFNRDGYVDAEETMAVVGRVLIPLDYDLGSQLGKMAMMPFTNKKGKYLYSQAASSRVMLADLRERDTNPLDFLGKLKINENISLSEMVVVIYGSPDHLYLPASVASLENYPANLSLPVACGRLTGTDEVFP